MDRNVAWIVLATVVGVVSLSLAAATLPAPDTGGIGGAGGANGTGNGSFALPQPEFDPGGTAPTLPPIVGVVLTAVIAVLSLHYFLRNPVKAIAVVVLIALGVAVLVAVLSSLDAVLGGSPGGEGLLGGGEGDDGISGGSVTATGTLPWPLLFAVAAFALVVGIATLYGATGDLTSTVVETTEPTAEDGDDADVVGLGETAGRAADRIEEANADADNEVYRAWREMTDDLPVDRPTSSTPGEFAEAAVAAGMRPDDVNRLTRLFEEVRYGGADPEGREQRAIATLRRIERAYTDGGDP